MTEASETTAQADEHGHDDHGPAFYVKIWAVLLVLLIISVLGPTLEIKIITLLTAFGIAIVKAYLVAKNFMHLNVERRYVVYLLVTGVVFILLFFAGVAPDVMHHEGQNWTNDAAKAEIERALAAAGHEHGHEGEAEPEVEAPVVAAWDAEATFGMVCASCHGATGAGDGPGGAALDPHPANFTDPVFWETRTRESIAAAIKGGGAAVGRSPMMPALGAGYTDEQLSAMTDYVMSFGAAEGGSEAAEAPAESEEAAPAPAEGEEAAEAPAPEAEAAE